MQRLILYLILPIFVFSGTFSYEKNKIEVQTFEKEGIVYFDLKTILDSLNISLDQYREGKSYQIQYLDGKLIFGIDSPFIILNDKIQELAKTPIFLEEKIFVPDSFISGPLSNLLNSNFKVQGKIVFLEEKINNKGPTLYNIEVHNMGFTKAVLYFNENVNYFLKEGKQQIAIELPKNISISVQSLKIEDPFIYSISAKNNFIIITLKTEYWSCSHYTLSSPFRIILDITKKKEKKQSIEGEVLQGFKVIIDPGHGGSDVGAIGPTGVKEKEITLKIALLLKNILREKGIVPYLTREMDEDLSIEERANFANSNKGDLFLSIHNNSFKTYNIRGSETYYLSIEPFEEIHKQNLEENQKPSIDLILWDLAQSKYLKDSAYFAELVQSELDKLWEIPPRGIKQAPLKVLSSVTMPAILVEIGFISNPQEEKIFQNDDFLLKIAQSLSRAIIDFKETIGKIWEEKPQ